LEQGIYRRPSDPSRRKTERRQVPKATLRRIVVGYCADVARRCGKKTSRRYRNHLEHVLAYAKQPQVAKKYPLARDIDREFGLGLVEFLGQRQIPRNGRRGSRGGLMSTNSIRESIRSLSAALKFAAQPDVGLLPREFSSDFFKELAKPKPGKDPLRLIALTIEVRSHLVAAMDEYHTCLARISHQVCVRRCFLG
ncbi:MAG: hypothetical protein ACREIL_00305, partial [Nitrospiraceae bacterium]